MISLFFSFLVIMFKFTFYLALFPFWLIWWFIKVVFFFMGWLDLLVEQLEEKEDGNNVLCDG